MSEKRQFSFEFDASAAADLTVPVEGDAALRVVKDAEDALTLIGNAEGFLALARACVLMAQPEAGRTGAPLRVDALTPAGAGGIGISARRDDRVAEWPDRASASHRRVTDILREQSLVRREDAYALLLKTVGDRPLAVYTVLKSKLGMPSEEVVRIGDNAPLVIKTYRDLVSAQSDADEIARAGGEAIPAYFKSGHE